METSRNTSHYWSGAKTNKVFARIWVDKMASTFPNEISRAANDTVTYYEGFRLGPGEYRKSESIPEINIVKTDSVSRVLSYKDSKDKVCVLNFASFKEVGGKFLEGSSAQEESLCKESTLYNVLNTQSDIYYKRLVNKDWNNLYKNEGIYSPGILFLRRIKNWDFTRCDVLSVAAPNRYAAMRYDKVSKDENYQALYSRIKYVLDIMEDMKVDIPILGAFGCGVFAQDPIVVASIFRELIESGDYGFKKVDFAIIDEKTCDLFKEVFEAGKEIENDIEV